MPQHRQYPALCYQYPGFYFGLVPWVARPGWEDGTAVVLGHLGIGRVHLRLVIAGIVYPALQIVGDQHPGYAAEILESAHMGADPVRQSLRQSRVSVGVV